MHLLWIRHAESEGNREGQIQGQTPSPLTPLGCEQAQQLGEFLHSYSWQPTHIYSSPLTRALQTAAILGQSLSPLVPLQPLTDLQEIHNGVLQGLTWASAQSLYPQLCHQLETSQMWLPIPEGETPPECQERARGVVQKLLMQHQNTDRLWLITHGGILPYLLAALLGTPRVWGLKIPLTGLFELELNLDLWAEQSQQVNSSLWQIHRFNQTPHFLVQ